MHIITKTEVEKEVGFLDVSANVRYWEDSSINGVDDIEGKLIPCRKNDCWNPIIKLETGQIINWKQGVEANIHFKVCDAGVYTLLNDKNKVIIEKDGYVPKCLCPKENGYGDYIIMDINKDGYIQDWKPDLSYFTDDE